MNVILTLTSIIIIGFSLLPAQVKAAANTYYVTQNGNGVRSGSNLSNAWSVSDFNSSANWSTTDHTNKIDPGDTVYFSGMITSRILLPQGYGGKSGNYITIDGWEGGNCNPVADHDATTFGSDNGVDLNACPSAAIIDLDSTSADGIYFNDNSYLIIQDFQIRDANHGIKGPDTGNVSDHLIFRRNYVHDCYNKCFDMADSSSSYITIGGLTEGDGNFFYNCAERNRSGGNSASSGDVGIDGDDLIFSYNELSNDFVSDRYISHNNLQIFTGDNQLIQYNTISYPSADAIISAKSAGGHNKIIRFNKLAHGQWGVSVSTIYGSGNSDIYVYGNFMYDITLQGSGTRTYGSALRGWRYFDNVHFWSNVISVVDGMGIQVGQDPRVTQGNMYVYNNTIYKSGQYAYANNNDRVGIFIEQNGTSTLNLRVANNIFMDCDGTNQYAIYNANVADSRISTFGNNLWYYAGSTPKVDWNGTSSQGGNLMTALTRAGWGSGEAIDNPDFTDANGADNSDGTEDDNLTLQPSSPAIDTGKDLSKCFDVSVQGKNYRMCYEDALDPSATNWTKTPPIVRTTKQREHSSWDRGAYVYTGGVSSPPPTAQLSPPNGLLIKTK